MLGVTQARVSQYLTTKIERKKEYSALYEVVTTTASQISSKLIEGSDPAELLPLLCQTCKVLRNSGPLCRLHLNDYPELAVIYSPMTCTSCITTREEIELQTEKREFLEHFDKFIRSFLSSISIIPFIPEIGAQIVAINQEDSDGLENVAAIPGRIRKVKSKISLNHKPEFGASNLLASILLQIRKNISKKFTSVISLKTSSALEKLLQTKNIFSVKTKDFDTTFIDKLTTLRIPNNLDIFAIIDEGSVGFEAITYIVFQKFDRIFEIFEISPLDKLD